MKAEFYAVILFFVSAIFVLVLFSGKKLSVEEEVLPSPFLSVENPYENDIRKKVNEINRQLFFLEYGKTIPQNVGPEEIEKIIFSIEDIRAKKEVIKRIRKYWWGSGIEEITFRIKHIEIKWYPIVRVSENVKTTFAEALYDALNGKISAFYVGNSDMHVIKEVAKRYKIAVEY
ncbi:MAG: hypothetical protein ACP5PP_01820 [Fervidobacterium sp.]